MSCKSQACYTHLIQYIDTNICSLAGRSFMTDYEKAMRNAIAMVYPDSELRCCWFHYCQAVKKNASKINGFIGVIRADKTKMEIYRKLMCLPLLPVHLIQSGFSLLKTKASPIKDAKFCKFIEYFDRQWMQRVSIYFYSC